MRKVNAFLGVSIFAVIAACAWTVGLIGYRLGETAADHRCQQRTTATNNEVFGSTPDTEWHCFDNVHVCYSAAPVDAARIKEAGDAAYWKGEMQACKYLDTLARQLKTKFDMQRCKEWVIDNR